MHALSTHMVPTDTHPTAEVPQVQQSVLEQSET
jgi:hypothetical protein